MQRTKHSHEASGRLYLGIDGGQSSTTALIADETGRVIGVGRGGPCNHVKSSGGRTKFVRAINRSLRQACRQARLNVETVHFQSACLGLSGGAEDKESYVRELIPSEKYRITHDAETALYGATGGEPGIIVIAGTGSMAFGSNQAGHTARAGGWGYVFGDEGGAFDLVRQALRAALRSEEGGGPDTALRETLLHASGARDVHDLLHRFYTPEYPRTRIASLAPLITEASEKGDAMAFEIVRNAARTLAGLAEAVYRRIFEAGDRVTVARTGGVFQSPQLEVEFASRVRELIDCPVAPPRFSPAAGALLEALRLDGNPNTPSAPELSRFL